MPGHKRKEADYWTQTFILPLFLFGVALLPRLLALDAFLTSDEYRWLGRSRDFLGAVASGDWAATLQTGHPGVTTMWTGSLGILYRFWTRSLSEPDDFLSFVQQVPSEPLEISYLAPMRFPTALLVSLSVIAFYTLLRRLFSDWRLGAVAALLLALDPFHVALSRILHHDALATTFMTLSLLPLLGYWLQSWSRRWLLLSGVAAGLGFLSKSPAMFLMPFCALLGLTWMVLRWRRREWRGWPDVGHLLTDGLLWVGVAWLTVLLLWPAMWVAPLEVLGVVFGTGSQYVTEGHSKGNFFLGQATRNPGLFFYPLTWLLRTTPLTLVGLLALAGVYLHPAFSPRPRRVLTTGPLSGGLVLYSVFFVAFLTLGEKKQDRYILPIYPVLDALAAVGLVHVSDLRCRIPNAKHQILSLQFLILPIILFFSGILLFANYPYYFTYYNPLLGGARTAARLITVGWGEGLDEAAVYLNNLPDSGQLRVTSWYHNSLAPFFRGEATYFSSDAGQTLSSDYAVVYINQIQRELPTAELVHYLVEHHTPVFTATMQGVGFTYIYPLPIARRSDWQKSRLPGRVTFFGVGEAVSTGAAGTGAAVRTISLRLYWENEGLAADEKWWIALQPVSGTRQPWQECQLRADFIDEWPMVGTLLESDCQLRGEWPRLSVYHLRVGLGPGSDQVTDIPFPEGEFAVVVGDDGLPRLASRLASFDLLAHNLLPEKAYSVDLVYQGAVRLVGYTTVDISNDSERYLQFLGYWQALQSIPMAELKQVLEVEISLLSPQGAVLATTKGPFGDPETWPTVWSAGQVLTKTLSIPVPGPIPPQSQLKLAVWLSGERLVPLDSNGGPAEITLPAFVSQ